jgi:hypothetical protein
MPGHEVIDNVYAAAGWAASAAEGRNDDRGQLIGYILVADGQAGQAGQDVALASEPQPCRGLGHTWPPVRISAG